MEKHFEPIRRPNLAPVVPTPSIPQQLAPYLPNREPALILNIGIQISPRYLIDVVKQLVSSGSMPRDVARRYLEKLIEYAEDYLKELSE